MPRIVVPLNVHESIAGADAVLDLVRPERDPELQFLEAPSPERTFAALRGVDVGRSEVGYKVGLRVGEENAGNHEYLIRRWAKKIPGEALDGIAVAVKLQLPRIEDLDSRVRGAEFVAPDPELLRKRFDSDTFFREMRSFRLSHGVDLDAYATFRLHLGKQVRHVVYLDIDCEPDQKKRVEDWRFRMEDRHGINIRIRYPDQVENSSKQLFEIVQDAVQRGLYLPGPSAEELTARLTQRVPEGVVAVLNRKNGPVLEDHRGLPAVCFDDPAANLREDAHFGVKHKSLRYVESYFPLFPVMNRGFQNDRPVIALAIGRELLPDGSVGEFAIRRAIAKPSDMMTFREFGVLTSHGESSEAQSCRVLAECGESLELRRFQQGLSSDITRTSYGSVVASELNINAYHLFAKGMGEIGVPVIAKNLLPLPPNLIEAIQPWIRDSEHCTLDLSMGAVVFRLEEAGEDELCQEVIRALSTPHPYLVLPPGEVPIQITARSKASSLDGIINQEQWWRHLHGESLISNQRIEEAASLLNARHARKYAAGMHVICDPSNADLHRRVGEVVGAVVTSTYPFQVASPELGISGFLHRIPSLRFADLEVGAELELKFVGVHLQSGRFAFMRVS